MLALYAAFGFELEEVDHPVQLPVLRRGAGAKPLHDDLEEQARASRERPACATNSEPPQAAPFSDSVTPDSRTTQLRRR